MSGLLRSQRLLCCGRIAFTRSISDADTNQAKLLGFNATVFVAPPLMLVLTSQRPVDSSNLCRMPDVSLSSGEAERE